MRGQLESILDEAYPQLQQIVARNREGSRSTPLMHDHHGDPAIPEDVEVDELLGELIRKYFSQERVRIFGEEPGAPAAYTIEPGRVYFEVDAIDGSKPFSDLGIAYGMVITAYQADRQGVLRLRATAQAGPLGRMSCAPSERIVYIKEAGSPMMHVIERESRGGDISSVASVAARPSRRNTMRALASIETLTVYTVGAGNPSIFPLLLSRLGWVYEPSDTKSWDLVFLVALECAGGVVLDLDGERRSILDELEGLRSLAPEDRYLPGYVAVCEPALVSGVREFLPLIRAAESVSESGSSS